MLINLLPHREEKRKRRKTAFFVGLGLAAAAGAGLVAVGMLLIEHLTSEQQHRNERLNNEIRQLDIQIKDIANLKAEIESLKARQKAVEDLQTDRNTPVHLLNELAKVTPEGIYLTRITQNDKSVEVVGVAQTSERVVEMLRNISRSAEWLYKPDLVEVKQAQVSNARDQKRLHDFSMRVSIKAPVVETPPKPGQPKKP